TTGGSFQPSATTIYWFHDWGSTARIWLHSERGGNQWNEARITDDGTNAYIEVNFTTDITGLQLISDYYGWRPAVLYSGNLPDGAGNIRANATIGKVNFDNDFIVATNGNIGINAPAPTAKLHVYGS